MSPLSTQNLKTLSRTMKHLTGIYWLAEVVMLGYLMTHFREFYQPAPDYRDALQTAPTGALLTLSIIILATRIPLLWGLLRLRRMFQLYSQECFFERTALRALRDFTLALASFAIFSILLPSLHTMILTWHLGPSSRTLELSISSSNLQFLILSGLFLVIVSIMNEGARIAEENRGFV